MIFKTFQNNDIDKWATKIGIFGKSFNELGTAINGAFKTYIDNIDNFDKDISFWDALKQNLSPKDKNGYSRIKNSLGEIVSKDNIDSYIKEFDLDSAKEKAKSIFDFSEDVKNGEASWDEYFDTCKGGNEYIIDVVKSTDDLSKLTGEDLVAANQKARASAIAHNNALKQQTLAAKAANVAMKGLALVGNMLASYFLTKVITAYSDYKKKIHEIADESSKQASQSSEYVTKLNDLQKELKNGTKSSDELTSAFKERLLTMDYTESEINNLIAKYNGLAGAISAATEEALKNARKDAYVDVASTSKALEVDSNGGFINNILIEKKTTGIKELDKQINELMSDYATFSADGGNKWIPKDSSAEGLYNYYNSLKKVSELIQDTASQTNNNDLLNQGNFFNHTLLGEVTDAIDKMKDSAEAYGSAIERLHSVDAVKLIISVCFKLLLYL